MACERASFYIFWKLLLLPCKLVTWLISFHFLVCRSEWRKAGGGLNKMSGYNSVVQLNHAAPGNGQTDVCVPVFVPCLFVHYLGPRRRRTCRPWGSASSQLERNPVGRFTHQFISVALAKGPLLKWQPCRQLSETCIYMVACL